MMGISLRFGDEDQDIIDAIEKAGDGSKSNRIKSLIRLGITVENINALQVLFDKLAENGLIQPVEFAAASSKTQKTVAQQEADEFIQNMLGSFSPTNAPEN